MNPFASLVCQLRNECLDLNLENTISINAYILAALTCAILMGGCSNTGPLAATVAPSPTTKAPAILAANRCLTTAGDFAVLDIFADGNIGAFTDGDFILAYLTNTPETPFTPTIPAVNNRADPTAYVQSILSQLDIDGNAKIDQYDGKMILAYEFSRPASDIFAQASPDAKRTAAEAKAYLDSLANTKVHCEL